jgi:hypothetical protein
LESSRNVSVVADLGQQTSAALCIFADLLKHLVIDQEIDDL